MKFKKLLILLFVPFFLTGCEWNFELYDPSDQSGFEQQPPSIPGNGQINVINPSNYNGTINYAPPSQVLLSKEEVYEQSVTSTVYITGMIEEGMVLGSGVVFSEDSNYAYIFTNAHVVTGATSIEVTYSNLKKSAATIVGYNVLEDVAVLSVSKSNNYTIATLQTSDNLKVGMEVIAIGTPSSTEYNFTATSGIISKLDSPITSVYDENYSLLMIQTDASLNNGNSGGPLFDLYGNLIGINSMKLLLDDAYNKIDDINFSIPMDRAIFMANSFFENKPYTRGKLGITIIDVVDLTLADKASYNVTLDYGIYVLESTNTLFKLNDVVTKINGIEFNSKIQFQKELFKHYKNEPIEFTVYRNGQYTTFNATLN
ncbi:MAG: serine protease [Bacilli bacterium]|nr:serine protease [Bacilli bacterium]